MKGNPAWPGGLLTSKPTWSNTFGCSATSAFLFRLPRRSGPRPARGFRPSKGVINESRYDLADCFDPASFRGFSQMGIQPELGLWPQRRPGVGVGGRTDPRACGAHLREVGRCLAVAAACHTDRPRRTGGRSHRNGPIQGRFRETAGREPWSRDRMTSMRSTIGWR